MALANQMSAEDLAAIRGLQGSQQLQDVYNQYRTSNMSAGEGDVRSSGDFWYNTPDNLRSYQIIPNAQGNFDGVVGLENSNGNDSFQYNTDGQLVNQWSGQGIKPSTALGMLAAVAGAAYGIPALGELFSGGSLGALGGIGEGVSGLGSVGNIGAIDGLGLDALGSVGSSLENLGGGISEFLTAPSVAGVQAGVPEGLGALGSGSFGTTGQTALGNFGLSGTGGLGSTALSGGGLGSGTYDALGGLLNNLGAPVTQTGATGTSGALAGLGDFVGPPTNFGGGGGNSLLSTIQNAYNTASPYTRAASSLYDIYARGQQADALTNRFNELNNFANNYYAPGSPEAKLMEQTLNRQDARAGRNSQYGTRATELAAKLAQTRANYMAGIAPQANSLYTSALQADTGKYNSLFASLPGLVNAAPALAGQASNGLSSLFGMFGG